MREQWRAEAMSRLTPTAFTASSTTASSEPRAMLVHVVLVLTDADRLRLDLDELGQRVLQPPGDGDRAAQRHVESGNSFAASSEAE